MPVTFSPLTLPDVLLIEPAVFEDGRGFFMETYTWSAFAAHGVGDPFVQDNHSFSRQGVLRGLHYQRPPQAQAKLVRVVQGEIFDVAVDIRVGSPTYGRWVGVTLSAVNRKMLYVPCGFAHGFCVISDTAEVVYKVSQEYAPECEAGIVWNDPALAIRWPLTPPVLSKKDADYPCLRDIDTGFFYAPETAYGEATRSKEGA